MLSPTGSTMLNRSGNPYPRTRKDMEYWLPLAAGLFGSLHCAGMCGPLVLAFAARGAGGSGRVPAVRVHFAYHAGRFLSYVCLGLLAGAAGSAIAVLGGAASWRALVSGLLMLIAGSLMLARLPFSGGCLFPLRLLSGLSSIGTTEAALYVGLCTPILPCGMLYAMLMQAAAAGSILRGGVTMLAFVAGTIPALGLMGAASAAIGQKWRGHAHWISGIAVILMGMMLLLHAFPFHSGAVPPDH